MLKLKGRVFGRLTVIKRVPEMIPGDHTYRWRCRCECGNERDIQGSQLMAGLVRSCGCLQKESRIRDLTDQKFGMLTAIERVGEAKGKETKWRFRCDCGLEIISKMDVVVDGDRKSCGCDRIRLNKEQARKMFKKVHIIEGTSVERLKSKMPKNNTSGIKGVGWYSRRGKWQARIGFKGRNYCLGYFDKIEDAAAARKAAEQEMHGEFLKWYETQKDHRPEG